jgi:type IV pilus assembly protein PilY1
VARDNEGRIWLYFGTGRFWSSLDRQSPYLSYQNAFYGIKEPVDANGTLTYGSVGAKGSYLRNVTGIEIEDYITLSLNTSNPLHGAAVSDQDGDGNVDFSDLIAEVQAKDGWYLNFSETGERNLGQGAISGDIVTFSTFVPNNDLCAYEGKSYLYGLYYKTGTGYWEGVLKTDDNNGTGIDPNNKVVTKIDIGKGYSETPNIHTGREAGSKAFVQTSTGAIIGIKQTNPGITKSGKNCWEEWPR